MKTLSIKSLAVCAIAIMTLVSCSKKNDDVQAPPAEPIEGKWVGTFKGNSSNLVFYYAFNIKAGGKLEVLNQANNVLGTGTWKIEDGVFFSVYQYTGDETKYNLAAKYNEEEGTLNGSYGDGETDPSDGEFELSKQ
ncbi:MAG: hypothetical protein EOO05_10790 [Chitinophagaceae bacterium]|nr:MAG: hypothetical protein EOO05_10790 [Chitinophagaceae bacterium]